MVLNPGRRHLVDEELNYFKLIGAGFEQNIGLAHASLLPVLSAAITVLSTPSPIR
jgi:hypothetical protein